MALSFSPAPSVVEGLTLSHALIISTRSTAKQRYDRYAYLYINDHLAGSCLAKASGTPNGTAGTRSCTLHVSDLTPYIVEAMRENSTPLIRVVLENYVGRPGYDYRNWFVEAGEAYFYTRGAELWTQPYKEDPTRPPGLSIVTLVYRQYYIGASYKHYGRWMHVALLKPRMILEYSPRMQPYMEQIMGLYMDLGGGDSYVWVTPPRIVAAHLVFKAWLNGSEIQGGLFQPEGCLPGGERLPWPLKTLVDLLVFLSKLLSDTPGREGFTPLEPRAVETPTLYYHSASYVVRDTEVYWDTGYSHVSSCRMKLYVSYGPPGSKPLEFSVDGYVDVLVYKEAPGMKTITGRSLLRLDASGRITLLPYEGR